MKTRKLWLRAAALLAATALIYTTLTVWMQEPEETVPAGTAPAAEALQTFEFPDFDPIWGTTAYPGEYSKGYDVTIDYAYSDRYFDFASTLYNPSLATMSLCLELSSWPSYEVDSWPEKSHNAQKLFEEIGFVGYAQNDFWNDKPSTHSIGVVAAHKSMEDCTLIALPVRGGNYYNEWGNNVDLGLSGGHTGFTEARDNVLAFLEEYITENQITGRIKLWVVGYSRGGAVANLTAGYLNENPLPNVTLAFEDLYCYTFEAPQGAMLNSVGADFNHANIHNIVNANDIVPMVGPVDWEFSRYNTTSRLIPTVTTAQFESARDTMLEEFAEILEGAPVITNPDATAYRVSEYAKTLQVEFDPMNFLSPGEPLLEIKVVDDTRQTMNEVLTRFISCLVESVGGRDIFYDSLQPDLIQLLELLKGYETGFDMDEVMDTVLTALTENNYENLKYVLSPVFAMNGASKEERMDQVVERLHEVLPQPEGFADLYGTAGTLIQAIGNMLVNYPEEVLDVALAFTNSNVMQAHHQELTLAWVRAGDPHYTDTPWTMAVPEVLRSVQVSCPDGIPVNVEVYDSEGTLAASLHGDRVYRSNEAIGCARNEAGEIILHLPADEEYRIITDVSAEGTVHIILSEYNVARSQVTRMQNYSGISMKAGDTLTLEVPDLLEEEFTDETQQGSTAEYRLLSGEEELPFQEQRGEEIDDTPTPRTYDTVAESADIQETVAPEKSNSAGTTPVQVSRCPNCQVTLQYGTNHAAPCGNSGHYTCDGTAHTVLDCGHYACTGVQHDAADCGNAAHYKCDGNNHNILSCGHFGCADGDHSTCEGCGNFRCNGSHEAAACGTSGHFVCDGSNHTLISDTDWHNCGHYNCDPSAANLSHAVVSACGWHFQCDASAANLDHDYCSHCNHSKCSSEIPSTVFHGTGAGSCHEWAYYICQSCKEVLNDGSEHRYACGHHFSCDGVVYTAEHKLCQGCGDCLATGGDHAQLPCAEHYSCSADTLTGHESCTHCGYCVLVGDHNALECGQHFGCVDGGDHGFRSCRLHYVCDTTVTEETCTSVCSACGQPMCNGADHTLAVCGIHHASEAGDHSQETCGTHYVCEGGDHSEAGCATAGHHLCDGSDHGLYSCGTHRKCDESKTAILCNSYCEICHEYWCVEEKIHIENQCRLESNIQTP